MSVYIPPNAPLPRRFDWEKCACVVLAVVFVVLAMVGFWTIIEWGLG